MTTHARIFAALIAVLAFAAVALQLYVGLERRPDRTVLEEMWRMARFFTILTTLIVVARYGRIAVLGRASAGWTGAITLWAVIVGAVYHGLLARDLVGLRMVADQLLHSAVPLAVALWWLVFGPKAALRAAHAAWWLLWPAIYAAYALWRGTFVDRYPYFFVDPTRQGWDGVALWLAGLGAVFWIAGLGLVALGRWLSRDRPRPDNAAPGDPRPR
ncbi:MULTISPECIES: Pr6Pr family membrane protein [unclassified Roseivivax]|uniref:Pr6Pr family membrane protein n=1 Tax=unclassified Roseivivax TaxID=2639302 RepID=UPI001267C6DF|nr:MULTISPECIES: Pr6Pr family membrane protein [unclassified Roseivivax]